MNKQQVEGSAKELAGKAQQIIGQAINSRRHQARGLAKQVEGRIEKAFGNMLEAVRNPRKYR